MKLISVERIVAGGHMTDTPGEFCYSSVVPIDAVRLTLFLSALDCMQAHVADCGNAFYMERHLRSTTLWQAQNLGNWKAEFL